MTGTLLRAALLVLAMYPLAMRGLAVMAAPRRARLAEIGHELLISPFAAPNVKTAVRLLLDAAFDAGLPARLALRFPRIAARTLRGEAEQPLLRISGPAHAFCAEFARGFLWSAFAANPLAAGVLAGEIGLYAIGSRAWRKSSPSPAAVLLLASLASGAGVS